MAAKKKADEKPAVDQPEVTVHDRDPVRPVEPEPIEDGED
jgi:hypothetical protein